LHQWGQFFRIRTEQDLEELAMSSPTMKQASDALWWVSNDPNSRQMVELRKLAQITHRITMAGARAEGKAEGIAVGKIEGKAEGIAEGIAVGKAEGKAQGVAEATAKSILIVLAARGISLAEEQRQWILDCTETERLSSWLQKAVMLTDASELFA
jgi:flagellar biosynthesis/type III secretory pathway protein FliH